MLAKRIIPCLDIKDGRTVKGVNFVNLIDAGNPVELAANYSELGADELVFLDISATHDKRKTLVSLVKDIASTLSIPFTVGGGINNITDADILLSSGADKISVNSAAVNNPELINSLAKNFGNQFVVVAIDARFNEGIWQVYINGGRIPIKKELFSWAKELEQRGAGEILFTSMNHDGTKNGFAIEALNDLSKMLSIPVIASGGAGTKEHFLDVFNKTDVSAALAASVFHFQEIPIAELKSYLNENKIVVRL